MRNANASDEYECDNKSVHEWNIGFISVFEIGNVFFLFFFMSQSETVGSVCEQKEGCF